MDLGHNDTRGSAQRLSEKRIRQATARASLVSETSDHSSQDRVRALEQQFRAEKHNTQRQHQLQLQEKDRELTEANRRYGDAEERVQLAEQREQATKLLLQVKNRELAEANRREADLSAQIAALVRELEGKTKELAAHNTEVWRIPVNRVIIGGRIGKGGWGEVLEGTVRVAVKRLHEEIAYPIHIEKMEREMRLLAEVRHPNLVQFIGAIFDSKPSQSIPSSNHHRASRHESPTSIREESTVPRKPPLDLREHCSSSGLPTPALRSYYPP